MILHPAQPVADIPSNTSGQSEATKITPLALSGGVNEVQTVVALAADSMAQGDYFTIANSAGEIYAVWLDIDANGTAPTGAAYVASDYQIEVDIVVTGTPDTNAEVAGKIIAAMEADLDFAAEDITLSLSTATISITQTYPGNITAPGVHNTGDTGAGAFVAATTTAGVSPNLNSKYFQFSSSSTTYYGWFNVNGFGVDPTGTGTGAEIALNGDESLVGIATAAAAVIDALALLASHADGSGNIIISGDTEANVLNASAGDSGFTINVQAQGISETFAPGYATGSLDNNPSVISAGT